MQINLKEGELQRVVTVLESTGPDDEKLADKIKRALQENGKQNENVYTEAARLKAENGYYIHPQRFGCLMKVVSKITTLLVNLPEFQTTYKEIEIALGIVLGTVKQLSSGETR